MDYLKFLLRLLLWRSILVVDGIIRPNASLSIAAGEGFITYLEVPEGFGEIKNCFFKFRDEHKVQINLNDNKLYKTIRNESVLPYARSLCGIKVSNVSSSSGAIWTLEAENLNGSIEQGSISIEVLSPNKINFDTRMQLEMATSTVKCSINELKTKHCKIVDILNDDIYHQCALYTSVYPNSMFECHTYDLGRMEERRERIFVDIENTTKLYTNATLTSLENATILGCEFQDNVLSCQAEMPDHKAELLIMDGLYNGHYSAYNTITSQSTCNLEIPKPFRKNDMGLWRIINYDSRYPTGCLFYVGKSKEDIILSELSEEKMMERIKVYELKDDAENIDTILCSVPFVIYDCYLKSPNNTIYFPNSESFKHQRLLGMCAFYNMPVIAGIWKCGARGRDYDKEIVQNIEVNVKSKFGETVTREIKAKPYDTVELMCKSSFEEPISHCAYVDPRGNVHLVGTANSIKSKGRVHYYGRGINKGECGIRISDITPDDFGQWKCQLTIYSEGLQSSFIMELKESETTIPVFGWIWIGVGVFIFLVGAGITGMLLYRRNKVTARLTFDSSPQLELTQRSTASSEIVEI